MIRTQVYLPKTDIDFLKDLARANKSTMSEELRKSLLMIRSASKKKKAKLSSVQWLLKDFDKVKFQGPEDLATNIDEYLYGGKK